MKKQKRLGFVGKSYAATEMRSPIWYEHLSTYELSHSSIKEYVFEENFGSQTFRQSADQYLIQLGHRVASRLELLSLCDIVISLKPTDEWSYMRPGSTLIGWFNHLNLDLQMPANINFVDLENIKISAEGREQKILYKNACVAGECGVAQTIEELRLADPTSPAITQQQLAVVLGYGNLGIGATQELLRQGLERVIVFTQRPPSAIEGKLEGVEYRQMEYREGETYQVNSNGSKQPLVEAILSQADIIVNAKKTSSPDLKWTFVPENKFNQLKLNMAFIDPVHKQGHGASFVETTSLENPLKKVIQSNHSIWFNGCNAMPSYRAAYASYVISESLLENIDVLIDPINDLVLSR